jgi:amino acid transporter
MGFFLFVGFEWVTPLALRRDSYDRLIPRSMLLAVAVEGLVNALLVAALARRLAQGEIIDNPIPQVLLGQRLLGSTPGTWLALAVSLLAILSTFKAGLLGGSRLVYALARERRFFRFCTLVTVDRGTPYGAVVFLAGACALSATVVVGLDAFLPAAVLGSALVCFVYAALVFAVVRLRLIPPGWWSSALHVAGALVLALLGLASLVSEPRTGAAPAVAAVAAFAGSLLLVRHFTRAA